MVTDSTPFMTERGAKESSQANPRVLYLHATDQNVGIRADPARGVKERMPSLRIVHPEYRNGHKDILEQKFQWLDAVNMEVYNGCRGFCAKNGFMKFAARDACVAGVPAAACAAGAASAFARFQLGTASVLPAALCGALVGLLFGTVIVSVVRKLGAKESLKKCVELQRVRLQEIREQDGRPPDLLVGYSWGGLVAARLLASGDYEGPALLIAPAVCHGPRNSGIFDWRPLCYGELEKRPELQKLIVILQGDQDQTTRPDKVREWHQKLSGMRLQNVLGAPHGMNIELRGERSELEVRAMVPERKIESDWVPLPSRL